MECSLNINGINVNAFYSDITVEELFVPLLKHQIVDREYPDEPDQILQENIRKGNLM